MRKREDRIDKNKKLFVLNTRQKVYTLHINDGRCCQVKGLAKWADFETEQSAVSKMIEGREKMRDDNFERHLNIFG